MCGFVAVINKNGNFVDAKLISKMADTIKHRGPDGYGCYVEGCIGLGFQRLSILDLSSVADQPMLSIDKNKIIVFNGEIFNYIELREELISKGYKFRTTGDTEVLLNAYCEWGTDCLKKLNGMWAFLIYDKQKKMIFGARDRFGIKPLYRYENKDLIIFASEIKAIIASNHYKKRIDWQVAAKYLYQERLDDEIDTFYAEIKKVDAGSAFTIPLNGIVNYHEWRYWSIDISYGPFLENPEVEFYEIFRDAVNIRLRSDVPVGVCLSGGLDSTSIICTMHELDKAVNKGNNKDRIQAFCYMSNEFDETKYINDTLIQTDAYLHKLDANPLMLWDKLNKVLYYNDEPVLSLTQVIGYELFKIAKLNGVKVVLNGQGADEYLAGYFSYFTNFWYSLLRDKKIINAYSEIQKYCKMHGEKSNSLYLAAIKHLSRTQLNRFSFYSKLKKKKEKRELAEEPWIKDDLCEYLVYENAKDIEPHLDQQLKYSMEYNRLPLYLRLEDRNSMANSVEARLPFMDYRLISMMFKLPYRYKMNGGWNKYILRQSMKNRIPESVRLRNDKMGFPHPIKKWFLGPLKEIAKEVLRSTTFKERNIYNVNCIINDFDKFFDGKVDISRKLFRFLQFELWQRKFDEI